MLCTKYETVRNEIKDGDIILYRGSSLLARAIQYFDGAHYNHAGVAKWVGNRLFTIDMWNYGIEFTTVSRRMRYYDEFCILRPKLKDGRDIDAALNYLMNKIDLNTQYDYFLLPRIALYKKTGINLACLGENRRFICSELVQYYTNELKIRCYSKIDLITPQDFIRSIDTDQMRVMFDKNY